MKCDMENDMDNYADIKKLITPVREIKASDELHDRIETIFVRQRRKAAMRHRLVWGLSTAIAAAMVVIAFISMPFRLSAKEVLSNALDALKRVDSVSMQIDVRTSPSGNFSYIDLSADFVPHTVVSAGFDSVPSWSIDKGGRVALGSDNGIFCWLVEPGLGWTGYHSANAVLASFETFISPQSILEAELRLCKNEKGSRYSIEKNKDEIVLTVHADPQGDFANTYVLNSSIPESENIRRYVIDSSTQLLKGATVSVIYDGKEIEVLRITDIRYGNASPLLAPPADITFVDINSLSGGFGNLTAEEATRKFLTALETWDTSVIYQMMDPEFAEGEFKTIYNGANLLDVGKGFRSGLYAGVFVPYRIQLRNGVEKAFNLALKCSADGGWEWDGGM